MKVLHISTWDLSGGAARGAYWLHQAMRQSGVDSRMFVANKNTQDSSVTTCQKWHDWYSTRHALDARALKTFAERKDVYFSPASFTPDDVDQQINRIGADIINLHWVAGSFLMPEAISRLQGHVVWTLRDMWPLTGGCHYSEGCQRYEENCGACPLLKSDDPLDITRALWQRKQEAWKSASLHIVGVSRWLASCAEASTLFRGRPTEVIHNGVQTEIFTPRGKQEARKRLQIPADKKVILFGAINATTDIRKGFHHLRPALNHLARELHRDDIELLIFGASESNSLPSDHFPVRYLGTIHDDVELSWIYSAADVTVVPSMEDACAKVPIESMACGTPTVCFDATGMKDIVDHQENGYLARCYNPEDLAQGILWVLQKADRGAELSQRSRQKVETAFSITTQAAKYVRLYEKILTEGG